ncbi:hypothetical protein HZH68_016171 [Vespula germanica]|uniref:Uncharacterized protein n=1 Tax=Vespula germanica TaxID=30212 RepID=A0A834J537_VESGE|nr:hypothetical protein HZH68_016171 [Vespula germanica]
MRASSEFGVRNVTSVANELRQILWADGDDAISAIDAAYTREWGMRRLPPSRSRDDSSDSTRVPTDSTFDLGNEKDRKERRWHFALRRRDGDPRRMCSRLFVAAEGTNQANGDKSPDNGIDEHRRVLDSCRCSRRFCGLP